MRTYDLQDRLREIKNLHEDYPISYPIALVCLLIGLMIGFGFRLIDTFEQDLYIEIVSIIVTVGILNVIEQYRAKKRQSAMHSILNWNYGKNPNAPITHRIFFEMIVYESLSGYITSNFDISDFKCKQAKLRKASFSKCNMRSTGWDEIDFRRAKFEWIDFTNATFLNCLMDNIRLVYCHLDNVQITSTSIQNSTLLVYMTEAFLVDVDFRHSDLSGSSFQRCYFDEVNFEGVNLKDVNFEGAYFDNSVRFSASTILPDGKYFDIVEGLNQLARYTDNTRKDFFKVNSSAYGLHDLPKYNQPKNSQE